MEGGHSVSVDDVLFPFYCYMELYKNANNVFMYVILSLHLGMLFVVSSCLGRVNLYLQNRIFYLIFIDLLIVLVEKTKGFEFLV